MYQLGLKCFVFVVGLWSANAAGLDIFSLAKTATELTKGVVQDVPNILPQPADLFSASKQLIAGYPFKFVSSAINTFCSSAVNSETINPKITPEMDKMQFQLRTACNRYNFPLTKANEMWKSPEFDVNKNVVILATGWTTTVNESDTIDVFAKAYNCRNDVNFVAVDAANFVDTLYTWSALNTEAIGQLIAEGLEQLVKLVPLENIHLIGHSLGAHIVGAAGRYFNEMTGRRIKRITGLDPAKPCFNEGEELSGIHRGDAEFIDIIHSNPGVLGNPDPLGDVDFYPGGLVPLQKGCLSIGCAHGRSWEYFAETVYPGNEMNFLSVRCNSLNALEAGKCSGMQQPMGYAVPFHLKGNYFLDVNAEAPYGKNSSEKIFKENENCGLCKD